MIDGLSIGAPMAPNDGGETANQSNMRSKSKTIWFDAMRDDHWFRLLVEKCDGYDETVAIPSASLYPPSHTRSGEDETLENSIMEVIPFRNMTSKLPFALRFKLELLLFDNNIIEIQQVKQPSLSETELQNHKEKIAIAARRLVVAFVQHVVPPLLEMNWERNTMDGTVGLDVDNFTLSELFAEAIGSKLCSLKQKVKDMKSSWFDQEGIERAMDQAENWLNRAIDRCGTEQDLSVGECTDIKLIKLRAMWPYAEYSVKFLVNGDLVPAEYEIINCHSSFSLRPHSRRGLREGGWLVRDRFCRVTNSFDVSEELVDWIRSKPMMCGREYELIFGGLQ